MHAEKVQRHFDNLYQIVIREVQKERQKIEILNTGHTDGRQFKLSNFHDIK